jgi:tellurite resistance protein
MDDRERLELLKAALEVAAADGAWRRAEMGVREGLAARVGVGRASLEAMIEAAGRGEALGIDLVLRSRENAEKALELLVAQARIDGEIVEPERALLVRIGRRLGIEGDAFQTIYRAGMARADRIRRRGG